MPATQQSVKGARGSKAFEGRALRCYLDPVGVPTIGYGITNYDEFAVKYLGGPIKLGVRITEEQADYLFTESMRRKYAPRVVRALPEATQQQFDAAIDFDYNTGGILKASWVGALKRGDMPDTERRIKLWNKAGGRVLKGLVRRRNWEWKVLAHGDYLPEAAQAPMDLDTGKPVQTHGVPNKQDPNNHAEARALGMPAWQARMEAIFGLYELPGSKDNPAILEMARQCGGKIAAYYKHDSIPWCALAMNWCLQSTGHKGTGGLLALEFRQIGPRLSGPAAGAIATKKRYNRAGKEVGGHVFVVRGRTVDGHIIGTGGNQSDQVNDAVFRPEQCMFHWPADAAEQPSAVGMASLPVVARRPNAKRVFSALPGDHPATAKAPPEFNAAPSMLKRGNKSPEVEDLQAWLAHLGHYKGPHDGDFGPQTEAAVLAFQRAHPNLTNDGIAGPATIVSIMRELKAKEALKGTAAAGAGAAAVAGAAKASGVALGTWFFVGIGLVAAGVLCYYAWKYRDVLKAWDNRMRKLEVV